MRLLEKAIDDADRDVRIAAVRFLGSRGYRNAAGRINRWSRAPSSGTPTSPRR